MRSKRLRLRRILGAVALLLAVFGFGCAAPEPALQRFEFKQPHMGTLFTITLFAPEAVAARRAADAAFARVAELDRMMTDYDPESELMQLCRQPAGQPARVSAELFAVLAEAQRIAEESGGAFDVTLGPVVRLWRRARRTETLPAPEQLARARASVGWQKLRLDPRNRTVTLTVTNMQLDLGGIAKGYAADAALEVLRAAGCARALVAASGDLAIGKPPPGERGWRVTLGALDGAPAGVPRVLVLHDAAISTSGDTEQFMEIGGKRYSHIVDPGTGVGLTNRMQVTVLGKRATLTDAFATAASVLGMPEGRALIAGRPSLKAVFVWQREDGRIEVFRSGTIPAR